MSDIIRFPFSRSYEFFEIIKQDLETADYSEVYAMPSHSGGSYTYSILKFLDETVKLEWSGNKVIITIDPLESEHVV